MIKTLVKGLYFSSVIKLIDIVSTILTKPNVRRTNAFIRMDYLGDNFIFLPFLLKYKDLYPDTLWIINSSIEPLYSLLELEYIGINGRRFRINPYYRLKALRNFRQFYFKVAVNLVPHRSQIEGDEILKLLRAEQKVCYGNDFINRQFHKDELFCNTIINYPYEDGENDPFIHIFHHEKNFFEALTRIKFDKNIKRLYLKTFHQLKKLLKYTPSFSNYIVIIPDASASFRKFPIKNWQFVLQNLPKNLKIIQLGINKFPLQHPNLIDLTGKTSLEDAMSIVMNSSLVIGNETGLTHLAYLSGVPTICILGGGHFGRFLPWKEFDDIVESVYKPMECFKCGWICKYVNLRKGESPPCISEISPKDVIKAIDKLNESYGFL